METSRLLLTLALFSSVLQLSMAAPRIDVILDNESRRPTVQGESAGEAVSILEASSDLKAWSPDWVAEEGSWRYVLPHEEVANPIFFRLRETEPPTVPPSDALKTRLGFADGRFWSEPQQLGERRLRFAKFTVLVDDFSQVYFQDVSRYDFHYEFARDQIPLFSGYSRSEFNERTLGAPPGLERARREAFLGSLVWG